MQTIDRIMKIINVFMENPTWSKSISEISQETDLPVSSLHRILKSMINHNLIIQNPSTKHYKIGSLWLEYGLILYDTFDYISNIRVELETLMKSTNGTVYLSKIDLNDSIIIERIDYINQAAYSYDKLGLRKGFSDGVANKIIQIYLTNDCSEEAEKIKRNGYSIGKDSWSPELTTIAAPIFNHSKKIVGTVSVKKVINDDIDLETVIKHITRTANRISWKIDQTF